MWLRQHLRAGRKQKQHPPRRHGATEKSKVKIKTLPQRPQRHAEKPAVRASGQRGPIEMVHIRSRGPRRLSRGRSYLQDGGGKLWAEPIPRSLLAPTFPIPTLCFRMGPQVNARSLRSLGIAPWKGIDSLYRNIKVFRRSQGHGNFGFALDGRDPSLRSGQAKKATTLLSA